MAASPAAERYRALVEAAVAQRERLRAPDGSKRWDRRAASFRLDPRREIDANLAALAAHVGPDDTLLDVGGGAGRVSLPIALRCREVINFDPSPGMRREFQESAAEAGITNARALSGSWPEDAGGVQADVVIAVNVIYFAADVVAFVEAMERAARKRVVIAGWSVPPPSHGARLYDLVYGEPLAPAPTYRELLPVLWEMGILPNVQVLPDQFPSRGRADTREGAIAMLLEVVDRPSDDRAAAIFEAHFDELFEPLAGGGFRSLWRPDPRELLVHWAPR